MAELAAPLAQFNATVRTVDLRNQCRSGTNLDRKVETDSVKHSTHAIGMRVLGEKPHQYRPLWRGQRRMWRLLPVYEERYDTVGDDAAQVGELPRQKRAAGLPARTFPSSMPCRAAFSRNSASPRAFAAHPLRRDRPRMSNPNGRPPELDKCSESGARISR